MRNLTGKEMSKRGCVYCLDYRSREETYTGFTRVKACIHPSCPYHELDKYDTYRDFLNDKDTEGLNALLQKVYDIGR